MKCPHCSVGVNFDWEEASTYADPDFDTTGQGRQLVHASCPECDMMVAILNIGQCKERSSDSFRYYEMTEVQREELVYPSRPLKN